LPGPGAPRRAPDGSAALPAFRHGPRGRVPRARAAAFPEAQGEPVTPEPILTTVEDGVAVLTLNNLPLNLVTLGLTRLLHARLAQLAGDPAARVLVVTGAGTRAFCAGSDVSEFPAVLDDVVRKKLALENETYSRLAEFPKPTLAALNGLAYGGGLELAV